jgi:hypothetical protein
VFGGHLARDEPIAPESGRITGACDDAQTFVLPFRPLVNMHLFLHTFGKNLRKQLTTQEQTGQKEYSSTARGSNFSGERSLRERNPEFVALRTEE